MLLQIELNFLKSYYTLVNYYKITVLTMTYRIKSSTDLRRGTSALSHVSPTYPVADRCVLSAPIAW